MTRRTARIEVLVKHGAEGVFINELLKYNENAFSHENGSPPTFPLVSEPHTAHWRTHYLGKKPNVFAAMAAGIPQLNFPIRKGLSTEKAYLDVTRRGIPFQEIPAATGLNLAHPQDICLMIHPTDAGEIPVLTIPHREDFIAMVRALSRRGEPTDIPDSMGATTVVGFNNWDRIHRHRLDWQHSKINGSWPEEFARFRTQKSNFQDSFILLSMGPYSGVPAEELDLEAQNWIELSHTIRREHEATHYFTRRVFASMRNNIIDEILADYMGIVAAHGHFRADWMLAFFGLSHYPDYQEGRRLQNYCRELTKEAFLVITSMVVDAVYNLEAFDKAHRRELEKGGARACLLMALTRLTLEELAAKDAPLRLFTFWHQVQNSYST